MSSRWSQRMRAKRRMGWLNVRPTVWQHTVRLVAGTFGRGQVIPDPPYAWPVSFTLFPRTGFDTSIGRTQEGKAAFFRAQLEKLGPHEYLYFPRTAAFIDELEQQRAACTHPVGFPLSRPLNSNSTPQCPYCGGRP